MLGLPVAKQLFGTADPIALKKLHSSMERVEHALSPTGLSNDAGTVRPNDYWDVYELSANYTLSLSSYGFDPLRTMGGDVNRRRRPALFLA